MTLLSLDEFRKIIGHEPYHFWQLTDNNLPSTSSCDNLLRKYRWQNSQAIGRFEIEEAITDAETILTNYLGFNPGPAYQTFKEITGCPVHTNPHGYGYSALYRSNYSTRDIKLGIGKLRTIGTLTRVSQGTFAVVPSDKNGDSINDYFKVDVADTTSDPADFEAYFSMADRIELDDADVLEKWQIRPVKVIRFDPNTIRIEGYYWLLVKPIKYELTNYPGFSPEISGTNTSGGLSARDSNNYVTTLDIYKKVLSATNKVTLTITDSTGVSTVYTLNAVPQHLELGVIHISGHVNTASCYCQASTAFYTINFTAGDELSVWKNTIARLALAQIAAPLCPCTGLEVEHWQKDRARTGDEKGFSRIDNDILKNPIGTREGQIEAWQRIKALRILSGLGN